MATNRVIFTKEMKRDYTILMPNMLPMHFKIMSSIFRDYGYKTVLLEKEIVILVALNNGGAEARAWGCDLTYDYVKINGDYRT